MCEKKKYKTYSEAEKVLNLLKKGKKYIVKSKSYIKPKRIYKYDKCLNFHLTSTSRI